MLDCWRTVRYKHYQHGPWSLYDVHFSLEAVYCTLFGLVSVIEPLSFPIKHKKTNYKKTNH